VLIWARSISGLGLVFVIRHHLLKCGLVMASFLVSRALRARDTSLRAFTDPGIVSLLFLSGAR